MSLSLQLAIVFSLYFSVVGVSLLTNRRFYHAVLKELAHSHIAMLIIAFMTLILGCALMISHPIWSWDWRLSITLMCALILFAGIVRTIAPGMILRIARQIRDSERYTLTSGIACLALGGFYGVLGYQHF